MNVAYIFDLDGTLSDPATGIGRSLDHALEAFGYPPIEAGEIARYIGPPLDETFRSIVGNATPERIDALIARYRERYAETGFAENVLYPGVAEVLGALDDAGVPLGVCTTKRVDFAERILRRFGIRDRFRFVSGGDIGIAKAQQLAALLSDGSIDASFTMVGDRANDILAAKANGLSAAAVLWGYGPLDELEAAAPDFLVQSPYELLGPILK